MTISASEAKTHFGALVDKAQKGPVTIEKKGRPVVVVLSHADYQEHFSSQPSQEEKAKALNFLAEWGNQPSVEPNAELLDNDPKAQAIWEKYTRS